MRVVSASITAARDEHKTRWHGEMSDCKPPRVNNNRSQKLDNFTELGAAIHGPKPLKITGFADIHAPKTYKVVRLGGVIVHAGGLVTYPDTECTGFLDHTGLGSVCRPTQIRLERLVRRPV